MFDPGYRKKYNHPRQGLGYREGSVKGTIIKDLVFLNHEAQLFVCSGHQTPTPVRSSGQNLDYNVGRVCYPILSSTRLASRLGQSPCDHWTPKGLKPETNRTPDRTNLQQIKRNLWYHEETPVLSGKKVRANCLCVCLKYLQCHVCMEFDIILQWVPPLKTKDQS
ncbi:hypothetical protein V6N13_051547 [Hibiscus sabdariffa]